ncbi:hypothetical protein, partial [Methylobacterium gnaphalii]
MQAAGFPKSVPCGPDGNDAHAIAATWNRRWDAHRNGKTLQEVVMPGSLAEAFDRYRQTHTWNGRALKTRMEWERAWLDIKETFGDIDLTTVSYEVIDNWYSELLERTTVDRAWRAMKIWRALWLVAAGMRRNGRSYTNGHEDPSLKVTRQAQPKRSAYWREGEVVRLVKRAWRDGGQGLACIIAVAWDSQLSPGDVRKLSETQLDKLGFWTARGKTGRAALGTISPRTARLIETYRLLTSGEVTEGKGKIKRLPGTPLFRAQNGTAFGDQTLAKAFARNRQKVFAGDRRTLMDMRRSGAVEANAGQVDAGALGAKMANSIASARDLQMIYQPVDPATVARADEARRRGRSALRATAILGAKPVSTSLTVAPANPEPKVEPDAENKGKI